MRARTLLIPLAVAALLAGCSGDDLSRTFGVTRDVPDEFVVTTRAPLSMPPDFQLRPPRPGAPRPQEQTASEGAESALAPQTALNSVEGEGSQGQSALIAAAGGRRRRTLVRRSTRRRRWDAPSQGLTEKLMFWRKAPPPASWSTR